jgi:protease-4
MAIVLLAVIGGGYAACVSGKKPKIKDGSWLVLELHGDLLEYDPPGGVMSKIAGGDAETLQRILDNLMKARVDDRIEGVVLRTSSGASLGFAAMQEIRGSIKKLREAGKKAYAYAESFDQRDYFLLAACDEIYLPPTGYVSFTGFASNRAYVKNALEKLKIKPDIHKIKDYKAAAELVTREDMSEPARENAEWMLDEGWDFYTEALAEDRGLGEDKVIELMEHAAFSPDDALEGGLVDALKYWDELEDQLKAEDDDEWLTVSHSTYAQIPPAKVGLKGKKKIAVIHAQGTIAGRKNGVNPLLGLMMGHETIVAELRKAREDEEIAAIVFRVDSGGGDALGSDLMGHAVEITTAVKPVVVSMVNVAASGGYHIAYRGTKIVADPMTVTGSIGSISGKFNTSGFWESLGVTYDGVSRGPMALMYSSNRDFTPEERERFEAEHWRGFNHWLQDVADHRGMSFEDAEKLAHGRVWSGRQAKANGLIDEVGGLERAVEIAKELAEIPADEQVTLLHFPEKESLVASLLGGDDKAAAAARWAVYRAVREDVVQTWELINRDPALLTEGLAP